MTTFPGRVDRRRSLTVTTLAFACVILAACGSQISPKEAASAGALGGNGGSNNGSSNNNGGGESLLGGGNGVTSSAGATATKGTSGGNGSTGGGGSSSNGGGGGSGGGGSSVGIPGVQAASCAGFANTTGITSSTITISNASDISGPVPGLFTTAQQATAAFVAYFNSTSSICGRKLKLEDLDSGTDTSADQQAAVTACGNSFAMVGSMAAFDNGGAQTVTQCGLPDLQAQPTTQQRLESPVTFGSGYANLGMAPAIVPTYFKTDDPAAAASAAFLYIDAGASEINAQSEIAGWEKEGFHFTYTQGVGATEINYAPYAQQMKDDKVEYVQYIGPYQDAIRLAQAMQQEGFTPHDFVLDPTGYISDYAAQGGSAVAGTKIFDNAALFEEANLNPEMQLYETWLNRVAPGAAPTYFGLFAWADGMLFTQEALALGGKLTRANLINAYKGVHSWTGNGLFSPVDVGNKIAGKCVEIIQLQGSKWVRLSPTTPGTYICGPIVQTGVG